MFHNNCSLVHNSYVAPPWTLDSGDSYSHSSLQFGLSLQQIMDVDEKDQIMMTNVWLNLVREKWRIKCLRNTNHVTKLLEYF